MFQRITRALKGKKPAKARAKASATVASKEAAPESCFWVCNGPVVKNIAELASAVEAMSDEQFDHHTKRDGNDFARWIDEVLQESACAKKIAKIKTRAGLLKALKSCL